MKYLRFRAVFKSLFILIPLLAVFPSFREVNGEEKAVPASPLSAVADVFQKFQDPPADYRSAPLWVWNDRVTRVQIDEQLSDFKAHGIGGVFIHPRPGLITPYLTPEWLSLVRQAVDAGKKLGLKVWLYDENSYPSGFAGGHVPAQMPDAPRTGLRMTTAAELPKAFKSRPLLILRKTASGFEEVTAKMADQNPGPGAYYIFDLNRQAPSPWYGGFTYVDIMRRNVTEKFLDVTMNAYKSAIGDEFGGVVPGVFQDEAEISPAGGRDMVVVNYTPALFDRFQAKWGYDLRLQLPSLFDEVGDYQRVRHNYYATLLDLFIENWAKPYYDYCTANHLLFTGHYWEHEWPRPVVNPDSMAFCAYAHMPGIDILMNDFQTDTHAQFGNARAVKEIRSAANQTGKPRTMSETFGAGGWDMTFFDQKRIADWEYALGVNFMNQHLSYVTIKGARKRDHPLSFSYHEPWWNTYKFLADYFGRLSVALASGRQDNRILVIEPTTTAWMYYSARGEGDKVKAIGKDFQDFVNRLEAAQVEYDLGSESILKDFGKAQDEKFVVGEQAYGLVILPPGMENLNGSTVELLDKYLSGGGRILSWVNPPHFVEGRMSDRLGTLAAQYPQKWRKAEAPLDLKNINDLCPPRFVFETKEIKEGSPILLFHHRRSLKDAELVFLANTNSKEGVAGAILGAGQACEQWDLFTGKASPYPSEREKTRLKVSFDLPPGGSLLLCIKPAAGPKAMARSERTSLLVPQKEVLIERESPNVLTLDYCDLSLGGKTEKDLYFYEAQLKTFKHHGLDRNPWDSAVQYKTNILDKDKFAPGSGFEAAFNFEVADGVKTASIQAVVERPELFQVFVNGQKVGPVKDSWWLDRAFGIFSIGAFVKPGNNQIVLKAMPFTIHSELEPVYVLGDFGLEAQAKGFKVVPCTILKIGGAWNTQGLPFYSDAVSYKKTYYLRMNDLRQKRFSVELGRWLGAVAAVKVNGKSAGVIAFAPFKLDITDFLTLGSNDVSVMVYGTLKNTLGPFHNNPRLGSAWPGAFQQGAKAGHPPGSAYSVVGYGLFDDFALKNWKAN